MVQTYESWFRTTLSLWLSTTDTTATLATVPTVTSGRLYLTDWSQEEWINFTGVSGSTVTGLTRWLSQTADPATAGTGKTWIAGTKVKLVAMHDQLADKLQGNQFLGSAQVYATTAARDTALGGDWVATKAYSDVYVTATGLHYQYNLSSNQWEAIETGTVTPNMTTAVAWKWQSSTQVHFDAGTDIWVTWAQNVATNWQIQNMVNTSTAKTALVDADLLLLWDSAAAWINKKITALNAKKYFSKFGWDGSDGAVDGLGNVTITGSNDTYIVKNYTSWAAGTAARILTITPTGCVLHIKVQGNMDLTNWTFNFAGKWTAGGAWSGTTGVTWSTGTATTQLLQLSSTGWIWWLSNNNSWQMAGAWGAGCWANGVASFNTPAWVTWKIYPLTVIQGRRCIEIWPWSGWWGWGWITGDCTWWAWWAWWGCVIVEVLGNLTLDNGTTVITVAWEAGSNGTNWANRSGWGGWGGWGGFYVMYHWTLTGTVTPTVSGWAGWLAWTWQASSGGTWWVGWVGLSLIEADTVFS